MKVTIFLIAVLASLFLITFTNSQPDFNGTSPGCGGSGCHTSEAGIVTAEVLRQFSG